VVSLKVNNYSVKIYKTKIKIFDPLRKLDEIGAELIIKYLWDEGFIEEDDVQCEIVYY
tara:strand:- start:149 stop:322 length:174 start_codon:yes stop_codon:yes gene_type:complete